MAFLITVFNVWWPAEIKTPLERKKLRDIGIESGFINLFIADS
ncbi:hypothetical protein [Candidatus Protochlamydia phocaeensis]|nr:hypothetical protein [Candidatus Protochlamydia phocaeensis]